ncbi:MAG TPA: class I SAM-dependent methyltransferase [Gemmatimonadaceae bacterium]|nr:class I SAM-dependent methyltransferase [Gemmatimonadaceae bacterium]
MKRLVKSVLMWPVRLLRRRRARTTLATLGAANSAALRAVAAAIREALDGTASPEERASIDRIEERRRELLESGATIPVIDYGAGSDPRVKRTAEQMRAGVATSAAVRTLARASKSPASAFLIFKLVRHLAPSSCIELGSCVGISASYQAAALTFNGGGTIRTLEGAPAIASIARETLARMAVANASVVEGPFHETLSAALQAGAPVDFLFNDGHHSGDAMLCYFRESLAYLAPEAVLLFDDINWSLDTQTAWREIARHDRVAASIDLGEMGLLIVSSRSTLRQELRVPL